MTPLESETDRYRRHLVVMRTSGIPEGGGAPPDAVFDVASWNPGEAAWEHEYYESVEAIIKSHVQELKWRLLQVQQLDSPYAYELIFETMLGDFMEIKS